MNYIKSLFTGRLNNKNFGNAIGANIVIFWTLAILLSSNTQSVLLPVIYFGLWFLGISICMRRFHDAEINQAVTIIASILIGSPAIIFLGFLLFLIKGSTQTNKYGQPDTGNFTQSVFKIHPISN